MATVDLMVEVSSEEGTYVALCRELDIAGQGDTIDQALADLNAAIRLWRDQASPAEIRGKLPVVAGKRLYLRDENTLLCVDLTAKQ